MVHRLNTSELIEQGAEKPLINRDFVLITLSSFFFFFNFHSFVLLPIRIEALGGHRVRNRVYYGRGSDGNDSFDPGGWNSY